MIVKESYMAKRVLWAVIFLFVPSANQLNIQSDLVLNAVCNGEENDANYLERSKRSIESANITGINETAIERMRNYVFTQNQTMVELPVNCNILDDRLKMLFLYQNALEQLESRHFENMTNLTFLDMSGNKISVLPLFFFPDKNKLETLKLFTNLLKNVDARTFQNLTELIYLDISRNQIAKLPQSLFSTKNKMKTLNMAGNKIENIPSSFFASLTLLNELDLSDNKLTSLPSSFFDNGNDLKILSLRNNRIKTINDATIRNLRQLEILDISEMPQLRIINWDFLVPMRNLKTIKASVFSQCCFVRSVVPDIEKCDHPKDTFSNCQRLIKITVLRHIVWCFVGLIFLGNFIAIALRTLYKDPNYAQNFLVYSMCIGDSMMGVYLTGIAIRDFSWRGSYYLHDFDWRVSIGCKVFGILAMISSEVCVMSLAVITYDRRGAIVNGANHKRMREKHVKAVVLLIWVIAVSIAVTPAAVKPYFYDEEKGRGYYGTNGLCLPLQLPGEKDPAWEYCMVFFGIFNFGIACYMAVAYFTIFKTLYSSSRASGNTKRKDKEKVIALRFSIIVLTDILCWIPIGILIFISLGGAVNDEENLVYSWFSICVATVNSAFNPLVYTTTTTTFWPRMTAFFAGSGRQLRQFIRRNKPSFRSQSSSDRCLSTDTRDTEGVGRESSSNRNRMSLDAKIFEASADSQKQHGTSKI